MKFGNALLEARKLYSFLNSDPSLSRYNRNHLEEYIQTCCERSVLIEAYVLALQYVEDLIYFAIAKDETLHETSIGQIFATLRALGKIDEGFYSHYKSINSKRNTLTHRITRENVKVTIGKITAQSHSANLIKLITMAEDFFLLF